MSPSPQAGSHQAGPLQSPFHSAPPVAPLFVRDRYGSADSTATTDSIDKETQEVGEENPWTNGTGTQTTAGETGADESSQPTSSDIHLPPVDTGVKAWSILVGAFLFEALIWGRSIYLGINTS